jgi:hypothetical protein
MEIQTHLPLSKRILLGAKTIALSGIIRASAHLSDNLGGGDSRLTSPGTTSCGQAQSKPRASRRGAPEGLHAGHARPFGQRSCSPNPAKASSVGNLFSNSW